MIIGERYFNPHMDEMSFWGCFHFFPNSFTRKLPESSDTMCCSFSCEKIYIIILLEVD